MTTLEMAYECRNMANAERQMWGRNPKTDFLNLVAERLENIALEDSAKRDLAVFPPKRGTKGA